MNTLFVPLGIAGIKAGIDTNIIGALAEEGTISPGEFSTVISIWGEG